MFSVGQQNASSAPAKNNYLTHLQVNNYTGADSWLEAKQKIHDACFGCCHQTAVSELSFKTIA